MSDNLRRFRAVRKSLTQLHPNPSARITRHPETHLVYVGARFPTDVHAAVDEFRGE